MTADEAEALIVHATRQDHDLHEILSGCGINRSGIRGLVNGQRHPAPWVTNLIADAVGRDAAKLFARRHNDGD